VEWDRIKGLHGTLLGDMVGWLVEHNQNKGEDCADS